MVTVDTQALRALDERIKDAESELDEFEKRNDNFANPGFQPHLNRLADGCETLKKQKKRLLGELTLEIDRRIALLQEQKAGLLKELASLQPIPD